jgi:oligoribonuclease
MLVWMDLETTGLDPVTDQILEIGVVITNDHLQEGARGSWLIRPRRYPVMDDYVFTMHTNSGLLAEVDRGKNLGWTEWNIEQWIDLRRPDAMPKDEPWMLAGSSVWFDRSFMKLHMPELEKRFGYRMIDVSTIKELIKRWRPQFAYDPPGEKPHRALGDLDHSIAELSWYAYNGLFLPELRA